MDSIVIEVSIKLRKDTEENYNIIKDSFIPKNGEVCLVETSLYGIRSKIGDGIHTFAQLKYTDRENNIIAIGYYLNNNFYVDSECTAELEKCEKYLYIDKNSNNSLYVWNGASYASISPIATDTLSGIMKLYQTRGQNINGTISQKVITDLFNSISLSLDTLDSECLVLSKVTD